jgi:murein DD-endopeptidase MepM/ murein hydrolase activator NlpD
VRAHASRRRPLPATTAGALIASLALLAGPPIAGGSEPPASPAGTGAPALDGSVGAGEPGLGHVRLVRTAVAPGAIFKYGAEPASFEFEVSGFSGTVDLTVEVVSQRTREVVRRLPAEDVEANVPASVQWSGGAEKGSAKAGVYRFQVHAKESKVDSDAAEGRRMVGFFTYKFPVAGQHTYGDGIGAGRGHRGQDVFADCGTPLEAARAGRVQYTGFQAAGAGHYVVIDGKRTGKDFVYMHLRERAEVADGQRVRTGQRIGEVGQTGNATGCHLHFELWSAPGWYEGGRFLNPAPALKRWDRYS